MTTFAIFYELGDIASLAATIQATGLSNTLKNRAKPYWDNGLSTWALSPLAPNPLPNGDTSCPLCHIVVMTMGTKGNLAAFRQLCYDVADFLIAQGQGSTSVQYLRALADDMGGSSGAVEPWPP
jgi:hypothetical protein